MRRARCGKGAATTGRDVVDGLESRRRSHLHSVDPRKSATTWHQSPKTGETHRKQQSAMSNSESFPVAPWPSLQNRDLSRPPTWQSTRNCDFSAPAKWQSLPNRGLSPPKTGLAIAWPRSWPHATWLAISQSKRSAHESWACIRAQGDCETSSQSRVKK